MSDLSLANLEFTRVLGPRQEYGDIEQILLALPPSIASAVICLKMGLPKISALIWKTIIN